MDDLLHRALALGLASCALAMAPESRAETLGPTPERGYTVELRRDPDVQCTLGPEEVLQRVEHVMMMQCTRADRLPSLKAQPDDRRAMWFTAVSPEGVHGWVILDDATGKEVARGVYPTPLPPAEEPHVAPPADKIAIDPGARCHMRPEEVAAAAPAGVISSMRCSVLNRGRVGSDDTTSVWWVSFGDQRYVVDDDSGKIVGFSGTDFPTTAWPPSPDTPPSP